MRDLCAAGLLGALVSALPAAVTAQHLQTRTVAHAARSGAAAQQSMMNGAYLASDPLNGDHVPAPSHRGEFIEVYSDNISTRYSEVYWTMQPAKNLPSDFVARFDGKVVAFTGYEVDSVYTLANGTEQSVPINAQYNHHHNCYLLSKSAKMVHVGPVGSQTSPTHGGMRAQWEPRMLPPGSEGDDQLFTATTSSGGDGGDGEVPIMHAGFFVDGNGGE